MAWIKNPKGRVVQVSDERKAFLLDPNPMVVHSSGRKTPYIRQAGEIGYVEPTDAEVERAEELGRTSNENTIRKPADFNPKNTPTKAVPATASRKADPGAGNQAGAGAPQADAPAKSVPPAVRKAAEDKANEAKGDQDKWKKLTKYQKEVYTELHGDVPAEWLA